MRAASRNPRRRDGESGLGNLEAVEHATAYGMDGTAAFGGSVNTVTRKEAMELCREDLRLARESYEDTYIFLR